MVKKIFQYLPFNLKEPIRLVRDFLISLPYRFGNERWCPVCESSSRKFRNDGTVPRKDAQCVICSALERHRFVWLYFNRKTDLFDGTVKKMLHIAPESCLDSLLKSYLKKDYITADLMDPRAMVKMDITDIQYPDGYFNVIYCSHVMNYVQDDKKAMRELYRVLKQDGWVILLDPIKEGRTFEVLSLINSQERLKIFGDEHHFRRYGTDYIDRLSEAGFKVKVICVKDLFESNDIERMGLTPASGDIYYCTKH